MHHRLTDTERQDVWKSFLGSEKHKRCERCQWSCSLIKSSRVSELVWTLTCTEQEEDWMLILIISLNITCFSLRTGELKINISSAEYNWYLSGVRCVSVITYASVKYSSDPCNKLITHTSHTLLSICTCSSLLPIWNTGTRRHAPSKYFPTETRTRTCFCLTGKKRESFSKEFFSFFLLHDFKFLYVESCMLSCM